MSRELLEDCILNSPMFRSFIIDMMMSDSTVSDPTDPSTLHATVMHLMHLTHGRSNKIAFIKAIREAARGKMVAYARAFPGVVQMSNYTPGHTYSSLALADSKRLAEHYIDNFA